MKNLLLILVMFISSITFAQECFPDCPEPVVFDFTCGPHVTDDVVGQDRIDLLNILDDINITIHYFTSPPDVINGGHHHIKIYNSFGALHTSFYLSGIKLGDNYDYGEQKIEDLTPENFKKLYINIENIKAQI